MALIKSTILSVISGSINGTTFSRNFTGAYARNRTVPVNPNTGSQQLARTFFGAASIAWRALTSAQRQNWDLYAAATPIVNRVGDTVHLKGFNWYVAAATFRQTVGLSLAGAATAPTSGGLAPGMTLDSTLSEAVGATDSLDLAFLTPAAAPAGMLVSISNPVSVSTNFYGGPWNSATADLVAGPYPQVQTTMPIPITAGVAYFWRIRAITSDNRLTPVLINGPAVAV